MPVQSELGRELKRGRIEAGYRHQSGLAALLRVDRTTVSRAENGTRIPTDTTLKDWCQACGLDYVRMVSLARGARGSVPDWFQGWRDVEVQAKQLAYFDTVILPAVARTEGYVTAVLGAGGTPPGIAQVAAQLARASVLDRAEVTLVIHEMALRRFVGSGSIMAEQLRHLAKVAESASAHVHIVPNTRTVPGMSGAFSLAHDLPAVHIDGLRGRTTSDPDVIRDARILFERIRAHALPRDASQDMLLKVAGEWESQAS